MSAPYLSTNFPLSDMVRFSDLLGIKSAIIVDQTKLNGSLNGFSGWHLSVFSLIHLIFLLEVFFLTLT